jgi:peptide/nickel transport system substrate-binding protein
MSSKSAILDAVMTKRLDGAAAFALNTQEEWDRVMNQTKEFNALAYTPPSLLLMWMNPKFEAFKNEKVRRALQLAWDKKEMTLAGWGDPRWGEMHRYIFPKPFGLADTEMDKLLMQDQTKDARFAEAKKLLAEAGYASGLKIRFVLRNLDVHQRVATYLADQYSKIGVQVDLMPRELTEARKLRDAGDYELFIDNPLTLIGDPDEYVSWYIASGVNNFTRNGNAETDKLWAQQSQTTELARRIQLTQEIERQVIKDAWIITLNNTNYTSGWWNYVKGFNNHPLNYSNKLRMETVWLDK